jgi:hypothetical protein
MSRRRKIQLLLWSYFWLLIFEGALRKWVVPGLSTPLLVIRDPIAIAAVMIGLPYLTRRPWSGWLWWCWGVGGIGFFLALIAGHRDIITAVFGARIWIFHLPLIFLFAAVFTRDDIWRFVRAVALVAIPMAVLIALQYSLPQSHFVNLAPGGEEGGGFSGALGKFRPPGTFSFTNGLTEFYTLAAACVAAWLLGGPRPLPSWIWLSSASLLVALPVSISRALLMKYMIVALGSIAAAVLAGRQIKQLLYGAVLIGVAGFGVSQFALVKDARLAFEARWNQATENEGGEEGVQGVLSKRLGGSTVGALGAMLDVPIFGYGIGLGTHVGAQRVTGKRKFAIAEGVWGATLGEFGPLLGVLALGLRLALAVWLTRLAWASARRGNTLPLVMGAFAVPLVVITQTSQPTWLGFIVVGAGMMLAGCNPTAAEARRRLADRHTKSGVLTGPKGLRASSLPAALRHAPDAST